MSQEQSQFLLDSLVESNLLVDVIAGLPSFDRDFLNKVQLAQSESLNFEQKLGHLYEDALELLFKRSSQFKQVLRGVQVIENLPHPQKGKRTLGEFDYLLETQEGQWLHVELAVKFYLAMPISKPTDRGHLWPGPDARDAWERKHQHMINHQFSLAKHGAAQQVLQGICGTATIQSQHLIYGCLFDRYNSAEPQAAIDTSPTAHRGQWLYSHELPNSTLAQQQSLFIIPKHLWPCLPTEPLCQVLGSSQPQTSIEDIQTIIAKKQRCIMLTDGCERYFVAPDHYPTVKPL